MQGGEEEERKCVNNGELRHRWRTLPGPKPQFVLQIRTVIEAVPVYILCSISSLYIMQIIS